MKTGAGNGARTRDPQLGKLMLYQLSYARTLCDSLLYSIRHNISIYRIYYIYFASYIKSFQYKIKETKTVFYQSTCFFGSHVTAAMDLPIIPFCCACSETTLLCCETRFSLSLYSRISEYNENPDSCSDHKFTVF